MQKITDIIQKKLRVGLPGETSHRKMAPITRMELSEYTLLKPTAIQSAVNVLLIEDQQGPCILLTQRPQYLGHHSGQISFPGGKMEVYDSSPQQTALRETQEEVGVQPEQQTILGALTELYIPPSNFWVYPFIHIAHEPIVLKANPLEVQSLIYLPIRHLLEKKAHSTFFYVSPNGLKIKYPCFVFQDKIIWGATAMILQELKDLLEPI